MPACCASQDCCSQCIWPRGSSLLTHASFRDSQTLRQVNKAEIDVFLELSCFFHDPADVDNLISGSSAFSKTSLNIWKFMVCVLLKPGLENFDHYFTSVWNECNCAVVLDSLALPFFGIGMKTDLFQSCGHCWVFQICWHIEWNGYRAPNPGTSDNADVVMVTMMVMMIHDTI